MHTSKRCCKPRLSQALFTVSPEQQELSVAFTLLLTVESQQEGSARETRRFAENGG